MNTQNNTIFISGGSAGIGLEIAKLFSAKGNKVIINGRNQERLNKALEQLNNAVAILGDLSEESERIRIANELKANYSDLNVIINNAGAGYAYSLSDIKNAYEYSAIEINTNYVAVIHFTELLLPSLLENENAAIVNVTSRVAFMPLPLVPTYSASKAALHFYTQTLRNALSQRKINVFELMPPSVNTEFSSQVGGENGIPPKEVADELLLAFESNQFDVPVGGTKRIYAAFQEAIKKLS